MPSEMKYIEVEKRDVRGLSPEAFESEYIHRGVPVILQGLLEQWPAYDKWTIPFFSKDDEMGNHVVDIRGSGNEKKKMALKDYLKTFQVSTTTTWT